MSIMQQLLLRRWRPARTVSPPPFAVWSHAARPGGPHAPSLCHACFHLNKETTMLYQLITRPPIWIWLLLAFLIYRGVAASTDRQLPVQRVVLFPLIMLALSVQGVLFAFGMQPLAILSWLAAALAIACLRWKLADPANLVFDRARKMVFQRGSWLPLVLMLSIFCTKFALAVLMAMHPDWPHQPGFGMGVCALYGAFSGYFLGTLAQLLLPRARTAAGRASLAG
jgi:hypothetical protein